MSRLAAPFLLLLSLFSLFSSALALPPAPRDVASDAPFSVDLTTLANAVTCPQGIQGKAGGVVFLVHGTGGNGHDTWDYGPYVNLLPQAGPGFDVCWVTLPNRSLSDAQVAAEYVAYNIPILAKKSKTGKISVIGHSQGAGLNIQWALLFWPSTTQYVQDYIALAGDFHGTLDGILACPAENLTTLGEGCNPSVLQQTVGSHYLAAQNHGRGGAAIVPTTSIYTIMDEVIPPEVGPNPTSALPGASVISLQALNVCGPTHVVEHLGMIVDSAAYALALDALTHDGPADASRFDPINCLTYPGGAGVKFDQAVPLLTGLLEQVISLPLGPRAKEEPPLKPYVCAAGFATNCSSS